MRKWQIPPAARGPWSSPYTRPGSTFPTAIPAQFQASSATWLPFGSLSAGSFALAPGASRTITLTVPTPAQPGDQAGALIVHSSAAGPAFAAVTSIPVALRSLVPALTPSVTFTGALTGGNGRESDTGQTAYCQFDMPPGRSALNAEIGTGSARNTLFAELINPAGRAASVGISGLESATAAGKPELVPEEGTQLHVLDPDPGRWTLAVDFYNTVSGTAVSQPFTVSHQRHPGRGIRGRPA